MSQQPESHLGAPLGDRVDLTYEQARDELSEVVRRLESGGTTLEEALSLWERGELLARRCEEVLATARQRLDAARPAPPTESH